MRVYLLIAQEFNVSLEDDSSPSFFRSFGGDQDMLQAKRKFDVPVPSSASGQRPSYRWKTVFRLRRMGWTPVFTEVTITREWRLGIPWL